LTRITCAHSSAGYFPRGGVLAGDARVVDQDVDAAECLHRVVARALDVREVRHIAGDGRRARTALLRIASWQDETLQDVSDAPFSLVCAVSTATILPGQEVTDVLAANDCEAPHRPGAKGKLYTFTLDEPGAGQHRRALAAFQGPRLLTAPDGHLIADAPAVIDSIDLPAGGPYTIEHTSETVGAAGTFTLRLQVFDLYAPDARRRCPRGSSGSIS
jgi:hypothetical protein